MALRPSLLSLVFCFHLLLGFSLVYGTPIAQNEVSTGQKSMNSIEDLMPRTKEIRNLLEELEEQLVTSEQIQLNFINQLNEFMETHEQLLQELESGLINMKTDFQNLNELHEMEIKRLKFRNVKISVVIGIVGVSAGLITGMLMRR